MGILKKCNNCAKKDSPPHFQDTQYGRGLRVHNDSVGCTVCGDSKYDKLWAPANLPHLGCRQLSSTEKERLGHAPSMPKT